MKHGVLIIWHKNFKQLKELILSFNDSFHIYVHVDRKALLTQKELSWLDLCPIVKGVYRKYKVTWGTFSLLKAELFLMEKAIADPEITYLHMISGQDYPIKNMTEILHFFERYEGKEFIRTEQLPYEEWERGTYERFQYFRLNFVTYFPWGNKLSDFIIYLQKIIGFKRRIPDQYEHIYGGSNWFSITKQCAEYIVSQKNKSFYRRLKYTFAPEESFFATIVMNSSIAKNVIDDNLRYIDWRGTKDGHPNVLDQSNWFGIITSDAIFCRKIDGIESVQVKDNIKKYLLCDERANFDTQNGAWRTKSIVGHFFDKSLARELLSLLSLLKVRDVADFGCGPGWYTYLLYKQGYKVNGYDGNPHVKEMSSLLFNDGFYCQYADFTLPISVKEPFELILCLEVGEHIPQIYEDVFIQNLVNNSKKYILLSWAIPNQKGWGHVNCHTNEYVIERMRKYGYHYNLSTSAILRKAASLFWFKDTIMFFERH